MASQEYYRNLSRRLSRVMDDIGVNHEGVMSRRQSRLIAESLMTLSCHLLQKNETWHIFGSQTEGSTTDGLESDVDTLMVMHRFNLIQDLNDWVPGKRNLLMIQDERFPGYCKLQLLKLDGPYPEDELPTDEYTFDKVGRVLLLHEFYEEGIERHGPAEHFYFGKGTRSCDIVRAIRCKTWPNGYKMWSTHPRKGTWPTPEMISYIENSGCFVVQVAHSMDENKSESWRISTSLAERCLMFSLNITQIRCYILIKMIVKTFIDPLIPDVISSYICKNLLFHCIENTRPDFWQESNLLRCVNQVLQNMLVAVLCMNCPSYFKKSINLFLGKVNKDNQVVLMGVIWKVLVSEGGFLREIRFGKTYESIHNYHETIHQREDCSRAEKCNYNHTFTIEEKMSIQLGNILIDLMTSEIFSQRYLTLHNTLLLLFALQGPLEYVSATLLFPFLCSQLATLKARELINQGETLSERSAFLYEQSLESDVSSSRLRFATYLYCTGQFERAITVLVEVLWLIDGSILICGCDVRNVVYRKFRTKDPSLLIQCFSRIRVSMCVMFSQAERHCCPRELQYEMYRSTEQEKLQRHRHGCDDWMDLACIDSLPYLCFLLYMTNRHRKRLDLSSNALEHLKGFTRMEIIHRETVYNLLGQCYEHENRLDDAFDCYCRSLRVRSTNNAARWHIISLLNTVCQTE